MLLYSQETVPCSRYGITFGGEFSILTSILCLTSQTGSSSSGTTTTGADISTTIPSEDWAKTLGGEIGIAITAPAKNYPLFFIDSEGMGIRQVSCALN